MDVRNLEDELFESHKLKRKLRGINYKKQLKTLQLNQHVEFALTNFVQKYGVDVDDGDATYFFLPQGVVVNRNDLDSLWGELKENFSEFWYDQEKKFPCFVQGLPVFELVNELMKLSGLGQHLAKEHEMTYALQTELFPLTSSSLGLIGNDRLSLPSYFMSNEANVWSAYLDCAKAMDSLQSHSSLRLFENSSSAPLNKDLLRGAYAAIAYGTYLYVNNFAQEKYFGTSDIINKDMLQEPQFGLDGILHQAKSLYASHSFKQPNVRMGGIVDTM